MNRKEIAVIGEPEFTLGFRLAGIRKVFSTLQPREEVEKMLTSQEIGIVILDEATLEKLDEQTREEVVAAIAPVFVTVSKTSQQEELRKMIIQSIGVDLLKTE